MCTNFDFLQAKRRFADFAHSGVEAEKSLLVSPATCAILARRALELAVKWIYSFDDDLTVPYQDNISSLIHEPTFRQIIEPKLFPLMKYVIKLGNTAVHTNAQVTRDEAVLALRNLHELARWIDYCYADEYTCRDFDESLLPPGEEKRVRRQELQDLYDRLSGKDRRLAEMRKENETLRAKITAQRKNNTAQYDFAVDEISEAQTRAKYIDIELKLAGWKLGGDCAAEVPVTGMPNNTGAGFADYVLYGDNGKPLAVVEAKKAARDPIAGSQQAKLYADCLQAASGQRPLIFITNGFETYLIDDAEDYPQRRVSAIFGKEELQRIVDRRSSKQSFASAAIRDDIANRYYQKEAILAVCEAIEQKRRKMLLVMATGSGKTRTAISIVDLLTRHNYAKHILFLADRKTLVKQAKNSFASLLPSLTLCNLLDRKDSPEQARMIFSTYPTMMNAIDAAKRKDGRKLFTPAHFDLIIIDESHRSIYKKYRDIFDYFDAMLLGLTATPKDEIDKNTYSVFELESGVPTFAYELEKAVRDGYLVDYRAVRVKSKIMEEGIRYSELSDEEKEEFEQTFEGDETVRDTISSSAINEWLFNAATIDMVLHRLMEQGLKIEGGDKLGKTILFAKNILHAAAIVERFQQLYPECGAHFIKQIDYSVEYADSLIDDFGIKEKLPQIAVSVDMLDTGVDIPEVLNLVFFKKVRSKSKFWQMIGRGTRLCKDLLGAGMDKEEFLIFDFCNNFDFFEENPKGFEAKAAESLTEKIFNTKVAIARALQDARYQEDEFRAYREEIVSGLLESVSALDETGFRVKMQQRYVDTYKQRDAWNLLGAANTADIRAHIAPLVMAGQENEMAKRFDYLMYTVDLAYLQHKNASGLIRSVVKTAEELSKLYSIPQVAAQKQTIEKVQNEEFWNGATVLELEAVREGLRELIRFIEKCKQTIYYTNFSDEITAVQETPSLHSPLDLKDYRKKVAYYLKAHQDEIAIYKLRSNKPLTKLDMQTLERILWEELGSKTDYEKEYGDTPVGKLVRKIVGLNRSAANEAFGKFLSAEKLNAAQVRFVGLIVDYIVANGMIEDNRVLTEEPFRSLGSITELFADKMQEARELMDAIADVKRNCENVV